jgi:hypothetical protein
MFISRDLALTCQRKPLKFFLVPEDTQDDIVSSFSIATTAVAVPAIATALRMLKLSDSIP